jgi:predicted site-specific integrase-resolvase
VAKKQKRAKDEVVLLSLLDAALQLGISTSTARRYAIGGILPHVRIANRIRIPSTAVARAKAEGIGRQIAR